MCIAFHIFPRMIYFLFIYLFSFIASETQRRKKITRNRLEEKKLHGINK